MQYVYVRTYVYAISYGKNYSLTFFAYDTGCTEYEAPIISSVAACVFAAAEKCLPCRFLATTEGIQIHTDNKVATEAYVDNFRKDKMG
jgi:hypothetical protein